MLVYRGQKLAVIKAKRRDLPDTEGVANARPSSATRSRNPSRHQRRRSEFGCANIAASWRVRWWTWAVIALLACGLLSPEDKQRQHQHGRGHRKPAQRHEHIRIPLGIHAVFRAVLEPALSGNDAVPQRVHRYRRKPLAVRCVCVDPEFAARRALRPGRSRHQRDWYGDGHYFRVHSCQFHVSATPSVVHNKKKPTQGKHHACYGLLPQYIGMAQGDSVVNQKEQGNCTRALHD